MNIPCLRLCAGSEHLVLNAHSEAGQRPIFWICTDTSFDCALPDRHQPAHIIGPHQISVPNSCQDVEACILRMGMPQRKGAVIGVQPHTLISALDVAYTDLDIDAQALEIQDT